MKIRVLCVDDEPSTLEVMKAFLERGRDLEVECVESAEGALSKIAEGNLDAVVSDYQMPEIDGLELLKALRQSGEDIPFIVFTGRGREEVAMKALNYGASFYLQKIGDPKSLFVELINMIRHAVAERRAQQDLHRTSQVLAAVVSSSPIPILTFDVENRVTLWNKAAEKVFGWTASETVGKELPTMPPEAFSMFRSLLDRVRTGDSVSGVDVTRLSKEGKHIQVMTSAAPLRDEGGNVIGAGVAAVDVTERRQMEQSLKRLTHMYAFLSMANHAIVQSRSGKDLLSDIAGAAVTHGGFRLAWIGEMEAGGKNQEPVAIWASDEGNKNRLTDLFYKTEGASKLAARAHDTGNLVIIDDLTQDDTRDEWHTLIAELGVCSAAAVPIRGRDDRTVVLTVCSSEAGFFGDKEKEFLKEISIDVSLALGSAGGS